MTRPEPSTAITAMTAAHRREVSTRAMACMWLL
jgi:hypothetical protein